MLLMWFLVVPVSTDRSRGEAAMLIIDRLVLEFLELRET
jgi:hypothetical protein